MNTSEWMGRYRHLVGALVQHANAFSHTTASEILPGVRMSAQEWQTLEYLIEYADEDLNMAAISRGLGIAQSSLSKYMNTLCKMKLVERYRLTGNRKSIIPKPTQKGYDFYAEAVERHVRQRFEPFFEELDAIPDEMLQLFTQALIHFNLHKYDLQEAVLVPMDE